MRYANHETARSYSAPRTQRVRVFTRGRQPHDLRESSKEEGFRSAAASRDYRFHRSKDLQGFGNSSAVKNPRSLIRPLVYDLHAYVPGEQPKIPGLIKLNTNENPYPPSPRVLRAVKAAVDGRLRLYPNPTAQALRERLAELHRCKAENVIIGNGSD